MTEKLKILVADDNKLQLAIIGDALKSAGFEVFTVNNGLEVYQQVRKNQPQIILLDIMMPNIDGIEICKTLKTSPETKNILIIIFSGKKDLDLIDLAYEAGAQGFILKSNNPQEIVLRIKEIIQEKLPQKS